MNSVSHSINYKNLNVLINMYKKIYVKTEYEVVELYALEIEITKKDGKVLHLGDFYIQMKEELTKDGLESLVRTLIDNVDNILYDKNGFIGILESDEITYDDEINKGLKEKLENPSNNALKEIYEKFLKLDENTKEYKRYSQFLEMQFNKPKIPDIVRGVYLKKKRKSILDYDDESIDYDIRRVFQNNIYESTGVKEYENNKNKLEEIKKEIEFLIPILKNLEGLLSSTEEVLDIIKSNKEVKSQIEYDEDACSKMGMFDKRKKELKRKLRSLQSKLVPGDIKKSKFALKCEMSKAKIEDEEYLGIIDMIDNYSMENMHTALKEIYNTKSDRYNRLINEYNKIYEEVLYHEENAIDIGDLYERVDNPKEK